MNSRRPAMLATIGVAAVVAGCGAAALRSTPGSSSGGPGVPVEALREEGWTTDFAKRSVSAVGVSAGGPPRDGIPPSDHPRIVSIAEGDRFLKGREPVIVVSAGRQTRAYPERILVWHEIVNDSLGGRPIAVTYCPLCNSAIAFDRRLAGRSRSARPGCCPTPTS